MCVRALGGVPGGVLGLEVAPQLVVVDRDLEVGEQPPDEPRILDLFDRPGTQKNGS